MSAVSSPIPIRVWRWNGSTMGNHCPPVTGTERPATLDSLRWTCSRYTPRILAPIPARPPIDWDRRTARLISTWNVSSRGGETETRITLEDFPRCVSHWVSGGVEVSMLQVQVIIENFDVSLIVAQHRNDSENLVSERYRHYQIIKQTWQL